ncbi:hypothetical protein [Paenibacillus sp. RC67]|uniref:hypothetical protein n=1 Tax=Paenibacillus sp. RC67 TaxID=3039392 RepID=UPI0024ADE086|nr:hypothetical protein [Paenibacillus sp. RC67]
MSYFHQMASNMMPSGQNTSGSLRPTYTQTSTGNMMSNLLGTQVKVNRGGPDSMAGTMVSSQNQFIVIRTTDGMVYVNRSHIKSITQMSSGGNKSGRSLGTTNVIQANTINQLLQSLRHKFVQINRGGPEKIEGFIAEVTQDFVLVVVNRELIRVPIFHIKTISVSANKSNGNKNNNNNNNNNTNNNKSGNNNNNNKSGNKNNNNNNKSGNKNNNNSNKNSSGKQKSNNNRR